MRLIPIVSALALCVVAQAAPDKMLAVEVGPDGTLTVQTRPVPQPKAG
jgi:hypothetical protein